MPSDLASRSGLDAKWMALALEEAKAAGLAGEVPVGAVVVKNGHVVASGRNAPIAGNDPTAHAELMALRSAAQVLGNYRLTGCTLYVTLEPCTMCVGAMLHSRIDRVVYGTSDPKTGAAKSVLRLFENVQLNHHTTVDGGVLAEECGGVLSNFFKQRRQWNKAVSRPLRQDALRTPDIRFQPFTPPQFESHYFYQSPILDGLQLHYLDEGPTEGSDVLFCLHSNSGWGAEFWARINGWTEQGKRVIVPDLIGFGRSDKFKHLKSHSFQFHSQCLIELLLFLRVKQAELVVPADKNMGHTNPDALAAPFPDRGYRVALIAFQSNGLDTQNIGRHALQQACKR